MEDFSKYRRFYVERVQLLCWRSLFQNNFSFTVSSFFPPSFSRYCLPIIDSSHEYVCLTVRVTVTCATLVVKRSAPAPRLSVLVSSSQWGRVFFSQCGSRKEEALIIFHGKKALNSLFFLTLFSIHHRVLDFCSSTHEQLLTPTIQDGE